MPDNSVPVNISAAEGDSNGNMFIFLNGLIDEVYVFNRALDEGEIRGLMG